jgi:hypothetical protein
MKAGVFSAEYSPTELNCIAPSDKVDLMLL